MSDDARTDRVRPEEVAVLVDFDGTITCQDVGVELLKRYSTTDWKEIEVRFAAGETDILGNMQEQFRYVPRRAEELVEYARGIIEVRPGWEDFVRYCRATGLEVAVVSGGLDFYVDGLLPSADPPLPVHCLRTEWTDAGWKVSLPPSEDQEEARAEFKEGVVAAYRRRFGRVWFIGNGVSDRGGAAAADRVWAVEPLLGWCRTHGIPATPFETFDDVRRDVETALPPERVTEW